MIKDGQSISAAEFKALTNGATVTAMLDGAWPVAIEVESIDDSDVFFVSVNYCHEVQFHLGSPDGCSILMAQGIVGACDDMHGWVVKNA